MPVYTCTHQEIIIKHNTAEIVMSEFIRHGDEEWDERMEECVLVSPLVFTVYEDRDYVTSCYPVFHPGYLTIEEKKDILKSWNLSNVRELTLWSIHNSSRNTLDNASTWKNCQDHSLSLSYLIFSRNKGENGLKGQISILSVLQKIIS